MSHIVGTMIFPRLNQTRQNSVHIRDGSREFLSRMLKPYEAFVIYFILNTRELATSAGTAHQNVRWLDVIYYVEPGMWELSNMHISLEYVCLPIIHKLTYGYCRVRFHHQTLIQFTDHIWDMT